MAPEEEHCKFYRQLDAYPDVSMLFNLILRLPRDE